MFSFVAGFLATIEILATYTECYANFTAIHPHALVAILLDIDNVEGLHQQ